RCPPPAAPALALHDALPICTARDVAGTGRAGGARYAAAVADLERTLVLVKPDGVVRGLSGEVLRRVEAKGYRLAALELRQATPEGRKSTRLNSSHDQRSHAV